MWSYSMDRSADLSEMLLRMTYERTPAIKGHFYLDALVSVGGHRSPAVACWASDYLVASSNPLRGKIRH